MNGTQQVQCGKSVLKDSCSCCDGMNVSQLAEFDIVLKWNLLFLVISYFSFTLTIFFHPCFFRERRQRWSKRYGITKKNIGWLSRTLKFLL